MQDTTIRTFCRRSLPLLTALLLALPAAAHADIYTYVDKNGVRHITNVPNGDPRYKVVMKTPQYAASSALGAPAVGALDPTPRFTQYANVGGGWRLITPRGRPTAVDLSNYSINWVRAGKPFPVNEINRRTFTPHIAAVARQYSLEPELLHAVISAESAFNPQAVSSAGAMGLMQLMPDTAKRFGVTDPFDPVANLHGGARYLRFLLDQFRSLNLALAAYNAGEGAVSRYGNAIPPYEETQTYVKRVISFYNHYRGLN
ncbi:MAG TPA: transglycosylase SLT domain-containing protein [Candidatus Competibacteraceae bacterium]|nr:transglycosylase SLT domain-containing protein [Candidatus Competibacteraceae bacterium]